MVKSKLALIIDSFIISFTISFISILWIRRYIKNANLIYFFLILIFLSMFSLILFILFKFYNKKIFKSNNEKFLTNCLNFLSASDNSTYKNFICKLCDCSNVKKNMFKISDNFLYINLRTDLSSFDFFEAQELFLKHKTENSKLFFIYKNKSKSFDEIALISSIKFETISSDIILKIMSNKNIYPIEKNKIKNLSLKERTKNYLKIKTAGVTKSHFKNLFFSGLSLLFISLITPFSNYYLVIGSILLIASIISIFKKDIKSKEPDVDFLLKK